LLLWLLTYTIATTGKFADSGQTTFEATPVSRMIYVSVKR